MFKKIITAALLSLACTTALFAYDPGQDTLHVGTSSTYPPYEFLDQRGTLSGFDIDVMEQVAAIMGKKIKWTDTGSFDMLIPAVMTEKVDMIIGAVSVTEERSKRVLFSDIYEVAMGAFVVGESSKVAGLEDLKGLVAAEQLGTVQEGFLRKIMDDRGFTVKTFPKFEECVWEIVYKRADFCFMSAASAKKYMQHKDFSGKIKVAFTHKIDGAGIGIGMKLGETKLKAEVDAALAKMFADGTMEALYKKWDLKK